jgi:hypothetical protein
MRTLVATLTAAALLVFGWTACESGDEENAPQLSAGHPGWQRADCVGCHTLTAVHGGNRTWDQCFGCHGGNGQPVRPAGHHDAACTACHVVGGSAPWNGTTHADYAAWEAAACLGCHDPG